MRVVSHTCSNTEIVCALGCADYLVGVDDHSDHPASVVSGLARIGPDLDVDVERIAALNPDLVITSLTVPGHEQCLERMQAAGLSLLVTAPRSLGDVIDDIHRIARALGVDERGQALAAELQGHMTPGPEPDRRPRILIEWWPKPVISPGRLSWANDLITLAGGCNPLAEEAIQSRPVTDQEVQAMDPEAVVIAWCGVPFRNYRKRVVTRRPAWAEVAAVRRGQVHAISEAWLGRPGPRLAQGLAALRSVVASVNQSSIPDD